MSLAPELPRGMDAIRRLREKGIITALSHSNATFEIGLEAVYNGAHLITHIYNGNIYIYIYVYIYIYIYIFLF